MDVVKLGSSMKAIKKSFRKHWDEALDPESGPLGYNVAFIAKIKKFLEKDHKDLQQLEKDYNKLNEDYWMETI